jgi:hypothetical protein
MKDCLDDKDTSLSDTSDKAVQLFVFDGVHTHHITVTIN